MELPSGQRAEDVFDSFMDSVKSGKAAQAVEMSQSPKAQQPQSKQIRLTDLWQPAFNSVWNEIHPFVYGRANRDGEPKCRYDELFLQGGRMCVDGDTLIATPYGDVKAKDFGGGEVYAYDKGGRIVVADGCAANKYEPERMYKVTLSDGRDVTCTAEHRFLTSRGWLSCCELRDGDQLASLSCPRDASASDFLKARKVSYDLRESYYGGHLSKSREDAVRLTKRLLGLIYRCSRDYRLCDEQLLSEADTYQDVLQLLADGQAHSQRGSHGDGAVCGSTDSHSCPCESRLSIGDCHTRDEGAHFEEQESQTYERLFELLSEIYSASLQSQTSDTLLCKVQEASRLLLASRLEALRCPNDLGRYSLEGHILREICDTLPRSVSDETYSYNGFTLTQIIDDDLQKEIGAASNVFWKYTTSDADTYYIKDSTFQEVKEKIDTGTEYYCTTEQYIKTAGKKTKYEEIEDVTFDSDSSGRLTKIHYTKQVGTTTAASGTVEPKYESVDRDLTMTEVQDTTGYDQAMNEYYYKKAVYDKTIEDINNKTKMIQQQDRTLELRLKQLDTEQNALKTELEAVKKVIENNVESTFKTFA